MNVVNWNSNINTNFYAFKSAPKDNERETSYTSGRTTAILANTRFVRKIECELRLTVKTELPLFWTWYTDTLGGKTGAFYCSALGDQAYRFTATPEEEDTDRVFRHVKLELEEVY